VPVTSDQPAGPAIQQLPIEGARQTLQAEAKAPKPRVVKAREAQQEMFTNDPLPEIRRELADILLLLK